MLSDDSVCYSELFDRCAAHVSSLGCQLGAAGITLVIPVLVIFVRRVVALVESRDHDAGVSRAGSSYAADQVGFS